MTLTTHIWSAPLALRWPMLLLHVLCFTKPKFQAIFDGNRAKIIIGKTCCFTKLHGENQGLPAGLTSNRVKLLEITVTWTCPFMQTKQQLQMVLQSDQWVLTTTWKYSNCTFWAQSFIALQLKKSLARSQSRYQMLFWLHTRFGQGTGQWRFLS